MGKAIHLERDRVQPSSGSGVRQSLHETAVEMPVQHLAQLAMSVNNSPRIQQNLRLREQITANVRTSPLLHTSKSPAPEVAQMALDARNVEAKAAQFLVAHARESELIGEANTLLEKYSTNATRENLKKLNDDLPGIRDKITEQTNLQADIIGEYAASDVEAVHKTFLDKVLEKDAAEMRPLFDKLLNQTTLKEGVDEKFKHRFLSYVLQSSKYATGEGRFRELMGLLGDREFVLGTRGLGAPLAGLESADDDPKSEKANARDKVADKELLKTKKGNLAEFVKAKRAEGDQRQENADKDEVGNIQIDMDSSQQVLPVYFGLTGKKEVQAYTSPMFTAVHHELGHAVNRLKGKHGRKADKYKSDEGALAHLTDEEELQNISLDQYSDKAFTDELHQPERIAHGAFLTLDAGTQEFKESVIGADLKTWDERTYKIDARRLGVLQSIKAITGKNWKPYTAGKSKPAGVVEIAAALTALKTTRKDVNGQLAQVAKLADDSAKRASKNRSEATAKFYEMVAGIKFDSDDELTGTDAAIKLFQQRWFP